MAHPALLFERHGAVARLILNRPEHDNMLNDEIRDGLLARLAEIAGDPGIRVVILTGRDRVFSKCSDWVEQNEKGYMATTGRYRGFLWHVHEVSHRLRALPQPVIAAVNGLATMGGFELALSCDLIVASEEATMGDGHASGVGGGGGSQRLLQLLGAPRTRWMLYTEELLDARRALDLGVVQQVFPHATFDADVLALAHDMVKRSIGRSLERIKALTAGRDPDAPALEREISHSIEHWFSPEAERWRKALASDAS